MKFGGSANGAISIEGREVEAPSHRDATERVWVQVERPGKVVCRQKVERRSEVARRQTGKMDAKRGGGRGGGGGDGK
jgi:hypothetical protein